MLLVSAEMACGVYFVFTGSSHWVPQGHPASQHMLVCDATVWCGVALCWLQQQPVLAASDDPGPPCCVPEPPLV